MTKATRDYLFNEYVELRKSTYEIANQLQAGGLNIDSNKVRRLLIKFEIPLRTKSEANVIAMRTGRKQHPTKGTKLSAETRQKIGASMADYWGDMSEEERLHRADLARQQWASMTDDERDEFRRKSAEAVRQAAVDGSKLEKYVKQELERAGYPVEFHKENFVSNERLEIDMFVPSIKTAIEIDGPTHFLPIWGEEKLAKVQLTDANKSGLLLTQGFAIIRVRNMGRKLSAHKKREFMKRLLEVVNKLATKFPPKNKRFIEIDI